MAIQKERGGGTMDNASEIAEMFTALGSMDAV